MKNQVYEYELLSDGTAEITKYKGSDETLEIPSELNGVKVTRIGKQAFLSRSNLHKVTIPEGITGIDNRAFGHCSHLVSVTIPGSVTSIGKNPFDWCERLSAVILAPGNEYLAVIAGALVSKPDMKLVCCPGSKTGKYAIPQGITHYR